MQNGDSSEPKPDVKAEISQDQAPGVLDGVSETQTNTETVVNGHDDNANAGPRGKKRKLTELTSLKKSRALSPPWKKIEAEGPTSFIENGRRKSGRTNTLPHPSTSLGRTKRARNSVTGKDIPSDKTKVQGTKKEAAPREPVRRRAADVVPAPAIQEARRGPGRPRKYRPPEVEHPNDASATRPRQGRPQVSEKRPPGPQATPTKILKTGHRRSSRHAVEPEQTSPIDSRPQIKKLRLNFRRPPVPVLHPGNVVPKRRFESLVEWLAHDNPLEGEEEKRLSQEEVLEEADLRERLRNSKNLFDNKEIRTKDIPSSSEPPPQYTHMEYLLKHVEDFQPRLERERKEHMFLARRTAHLAYAEWKRRQPQSEEEAIQKQRRQVELNFRKWMKELEQRWNEVMNVVKSRKLAQWEQEQQALGKKALHDMLEHSSKLLIERRRQDSLTAEGDTTSQASASDDDSAGSEEASPVSSDDDDDDSSSTGGSDSERSDTSQAFSDDQLTAEELRQKYAHVSDDPSGGALDETMVESDSPAVRQTPGLLDMLDDNEVLRTTQDVAVDDHDVSRYQLDDVDDVLLDDSNEESNSDDGTTDTSEDDDTSNSDEESDGSEASDSIADDEPGNSLLGFFSMGRRKEIAKESNSEPKTQQILNVAPLQTTGGAADSAQNEKEPRISETNLDVEILPDADPPQNTISDDIVSSSEALTDQRTPNTTTETKPSDSDSATSIESEDQLQSSDLTALVVSNATSAIKTDIPPLLRGSLREYQHYGLDWLAGMYANNTNGILADEMGLGKTIQTIALLAHLATLEKDPVWGPHLVVVPTSVMLNWEMEFKKWCPGFKVLTYYGTQDERKEKRKGWASDDRWNVVITSYQLALQDVAPLKRKHWHYMILDEAHNIKNFRSKRWETLLTFNTQRRLLLTGTPLQNNLSELWSLLFFLDPGNQSQDGFQFADLTTFSKMFHRPVEQILEHGRDAMDDDAKEVVMKLHKVLRPHLLRRLKADVEKQMPKKYEHITKCRLSKRQRQLYDGYMGLAGTRESFTSGNYLSIINCLMQLRKVCNHPDLFETRQIVTSYAMPKSVVADYEIKDLLVRRTLLNTQDKTVNLRFVNLRPSKGTTMDAYRAERLSALKILQAIAQKQARGMPDRAHFVFDGRSVDSAITGLDTSLRSTRLSEIADQYKYTYSRIYVRSLYSENFLRLMTAVQPLYPITAPPSNRAQLTNHYLNNPSSLHDMIKTLPQRAESLQSTIQRFGCVTPAVVAPNMTRYALTEAGTKIVERARTEYPDDYFHEPRVRLSIAFPDKSLIQYDCGKLQQLARLLRQLQDGGHRALIFTQMTKVLDILEQFLNLHGHRYLRLDGATRVEQRQILTDRFNNDPRILAFILSSRSGGIGINLTGADTVIFYDLDWNPAMDKQCQDRCHRIGQTRDVHIYRFVCEGTIEANILRKSNQKRMLDDIVIQEGEFTTDYFNAMELDGMTDGRDEIDAEADAALDKVLGGGRRPMDRVLEQAEDKEDRDAAIVAQREYVADDADFEEKAAAAAEAASASAAAATPRTDAPSTPLDRPTPADADAEAAPEDETAAHDKDAAEQNHEADMADAGADAADEQAEADDADEPGSHEDYMLRFMEWDLRDAVVVPASERNRKRAKKGKEHGVRVRR